MVKHRASLSLRQAVKKMSEPCLRFTIMCFHPVSLVAVAVCENGSIWTRHLMLHIFSAFYVSHMPDRWWNSILALALSPKKNDLSFCELKIEAFSVCLSVCLSLSLCVFIVAHGTLTIVLRRFDDSLNIYCKTCLTYFAFSFSLNLFFIALLNGAQCFSCVQMLSKE